MLGPWWPGDYNIIGHFLCKSRLVNSLGMELVLEIRILTAGIHEHVICRVKEDYSLHMSLSNIVLESKIQHVQA